MAVWAGEMPNRVTEVPPLARGTKPSEEDRRRAVHAGASETGPTIDMGTPETPLPPPPNVQGTSRSLGLVPGARDPVVRWVTRCCGQGGAVEGNTSLASFGPAAPCLDRAGWARCATP